MYMYIGCTVPPLHNAFSMVVYLYIVHVHVCILHFWFFTCTCIIMVCFYNILCGFYMKLCALFLHQGLGVVNDVITLTADQQSTRMEDTEQSVQGLFSSSRPSGERGLPLVTSLLSEDSAPPTREKEKKVVIEIIEEVGRGLEDEETIQRVEKSKILCHFYVIQLEKEL